MPAEALYGALAFGGMFVLWVVLPSIIRKGRQTQLTTDASGGQEPGQPEADT